MMVNVFSEFSAASLLGSDHRHRARFAHASANVRQAKEGPLEDRMKWGQAEWGLAVR